MAAKPANVSGRRTNGSRRRVWEQKQGVKPTSTGSRARTDAKECTKASKRAVRRSKGTGTSNAFKPTHVLYKEAWDDKGSYTEHICYDCGANEEVTIAVRKKKSTRLRKVSCQLKKVRASEGTYRWGPSFCDNNAREFRVGAYVGALGRLEEQQAISPKDCRDKK